MARSNIQIMEMDTDAIYFALSGPTLKSVIMPDMVKEHLQLLYCDCKDIAIIADDKHLVTRECCEKHAKQDCLVLSLFKKEWSGKELVALNSKLYIGSTPYLEKEYPSHNYKHMLYRSLLSKACKIKKGWMLEI